MAVRSWRPALAVAATVDACDPESLLCHEGANQKWRLEAVGEGDRFVARHSGKCLDVTSQSTDDGTDIVQWQ